MDTLVNSKWKEVAKSHRCLTTYKKVVVFYEEVDPEAFYLFVLEEQRKLDPVVYSKIEWEKVDAKTVGDIYVLRTTLDSSG